MSNFSKVIGSFRNKVIRSLKNGGFISLYRQLKVFFLIKTSKKTEFHFVQDYQKRVKNLIRSYPIDEAMSLAVGGNYFEIGNIEKDILLQYGLKPNMSIVDYGCGSGRLAHALPIEYNINYIGIDILDELINYAKTKSPANYKFIKHRKLSVPLNSESADMICAFSVFTHLLHEESYIYIEDMKRVLKKGGKLVFSFCEFGLPEHWPVFLSTVDNQRIGILPDLNTFIEKSVIKIWAERLEFKLLEMVDGNNKKFNGKCLGQSLAILEKPE
ncbi:MAG: class I SAM-dependent methyltransferase [Treponema sp.]|jgi:SAM-dependent methyltransferase|nr:class I SAM-dependent methyltransferase [Treponema sp.]